MAKHGKALSLRVFEELEKNFGERTNMLRPITDEVLERYYQLLEQTGQEMEAAEICGLGLYRERQLRKTNPEHEYRVRVSLARFNELVEATIIQRAIYGTEEPLTFQGRQTGEYVTKYSDTLLLALAKAKLPAFNDKLTVVSGEEGDDPNASRLDLRKLTKEQREALRTLTSAAMSSPAEIDEESS